MATDNNLQFIREKVNQLRTAVMYSMSNSLERLPNDIVTALKVDEQGELWFVCRSPLLKEYEHSFPARLCFYRKGYDFFVEVSGKATVVNDYLSSEYNEKEKDMDTADDQKFLLVKMKMTNISYTEPNSRKPKSKLEVFLENGYKWFLRTAAYKQGSVSVLAKLHQTNFYGKNQA
jgi:general stress protein 26